MLPEYSLALWGGILAVTVIAGFVKGTVGFAMPMIMISGLGSLLPAETAIAALIIPTLVTNAFQAFRGGRIAVWQSAKRHKRYVAIVLVMILFSAQLVAILPQWALFLILGVPVVVFAAIQLAGIHFTIPPERRLAADIGIGGTAGFFGGLSGVWGPPTVLYLTALDTPKAEQMRVQGIVYGMGAVMLTLAHINSGVFNMTSAPLSVLLLAPALVGMALGTRVSDRLDQQKFRKATLVVLVFAGLNLIRRGLM
ncbi:MAG: sulfite exporter TauE/SafE family protein [Pseudomonadota bacterium]